jgi:hypothetical protein
MKNIIVYGGFGSQKSEGMKAWTPAAKSLSRSIYLDCLKSKKIDLDRDLAAGVYQSL